MTNRQKVVRTRKSFRLDLGGYFDTDMRRGETEYNPHPKKSFPRMSKLSQSRPLEDHLVWQLSLSGSVRSGESDRAADYRKFDDDGYLRMTLEELVTGTDYP